MSENKGLLKIGVMGSGNFGGQVATRASEVGFDAIAVNASERDLKMLGNKVIPYLVGDGKGTGKNDEYAKQFLLDHINFIEDPKIVEFITSNDLIVLAGSAGGGFGSNTIPVFADILTQIYENKLFIVLTTFPEAAETYTAQKYTEQFMASILNTGKTIETAEGLVPMDPICPYMIYDNENFKSLSPAAMNESILSAIVRDLRIMSGQYILPTRSGGIDERDLLTTLSVPGRIMINSIEHIDESQLVDKSLVKSIRQEMDDCAHCKMVDDKLILASAVMYNLSGDLVRYASSVKTEVQDIFGAHITDYRNEVVDGVEDDDFIAVILAGLSAPTTRIDRVISRRQSIEKEIAERKSASTKLGSVESGLLSLSVKSFGGAAKPVKDINSILKSVVDKNKK